jgi:outer membrane protein OmpA-like peptidoglycan-associated protein
MNGDHGRRWFRSLAPVAVLATTALTATTALLAASAWAGLEPNETSLFAGVGGGMGFVSGSEFASAPGGANVLLGAGLARRLRHWTLDGELGWTYQRVSGEDEQGLPVTIRTRAGYVALSARYRLSDRWSIGPSWQLNYGTDTSFAPRVGEGTGNSLLGARAAYEMPWGRFPVRFWQQISTDVSVSNRQAWVFMTGLQIGLPLRFRDRVGILPDSIRVSASAPAPEPEVRISLDPQKIFFSTNSARLKHGVHEALRSVGEYLAGATGGWERLEVSGHADRRGRFAYNLRLSRSRADAVRAALVGGGAPGDRIRTEGYSYLKPLDPGTGPAAWARNRRVELVFSQVADPGELIERLRPLMNEAPYDGEARHERNHLDEAKSAKP